MTIGKKIIGGYAIVLALLVLVTGVAFYSLEKTRATYDRFLDVDERLVDGANELRFSLRDQVAHYRAILLSIRISRRHTGTNCKTIIASSRRSSRKYAASCPAPRA